VDGDTVNMLFADPAQAANTKVKMVITSYDGTGTVIKTATSGEVNLPG